jgi:hypothetical protein
MECILLSFSFASRKSLSGRIFEGRSDFGGRIPPFGVKLLTVKDGATHS